jgi:hypothetical protein
MKRLPWSVYHADGTRLQLVDDRYDLVVGVVEVIDMLHKVGVDDVAILSDQADIAVADVVEGCSCRP